MTEPELQQYLLREYPQENARCEWKEFKNLKNSFRGNEKDDVISYVLEDCILLDAVQKGHRLSEIDAMNLLERGLVEGEYPDLTISLSIARQTKQLPEYTKVKGLERDKLKQMALQFIQNAGEDGAKKNSLLDYLKEVLPQRNSQEQNLRLLGNILSEMNTEGSVVLRGKLWFACK